MDCASEICLFLRPHARSFAAGVLTIIPGALVICFIRNHIAKGFALGRV